MYHILLLTLVLSITIGFVGGRVSVLGSSQYKMDQRNLQYYQETFLRRVGSVWLPDRGEYVNFNILSTNGGETWHSVQELNGGFIITGEADSQVIKQLRAQDSLEEYVKKHGPIIVTGNNSAEEMKILEQAGIEVKKIK